MPTPLHDAYDTTFSRNIPTPLPFATASHAAFSFETLGLGGVNQPLSVNGPVQEIF